MDRHVRRELLDRMLIVGQRHLEAALPGDMAATTSIGRTAHRARHRSLGQAPPLGATPLPVPPASIRVARLDRIGGLIHESAQVQVA